MSDVKMTGTVAWFNSKNGYGFVTKDDNSGDLFVHWSNIDMDGFKTLKQGQKVSFDLGTNHKGQQAVAVKVLGEG